MGNKSGKFCMDVSKLSKTQQKDFAKAISKTVDSFNKSVPESDENDE